MRRNIPTSLPGLVGLLVLFSITPAGGAALLRATAGGEDQIIVAPGESFTIDIILDAPDGQVHNSSLFNILFTHPGLMFESYTWAAPYENGNIFDFSSPQLSALPLPIEPSLNPGPGSSLVMSNVVPSGTFTTGVLVTLNLSVPDEWNGPNTIGILPDPDTFANGFEVLPVEQGSGVLVIVPSPAGLSIALGAGAMALIRRRRPSALSAHRSRFMSPAQSPRLTP